MSHSRLPILKNGCHKPVPTCKKNPDRNGKHSSLYPIAELSHISISLFQECPNSAIDYGVDHAANLTSRVELKGS